MQTGLAAATAGDCGWVTTENRLGSGQGGEVLGSIQAQRQGFRGEKSWSPDLGQQLSTIRERERKRASTNRNITTPTTAL